jgi:K+-transporting ATPase ATPase A chain
MVKNQRHGWAVYGARWPILFLAGVVVCYGPRPTATPSTRARVAASDGNMEGKEVRFGIVNSALCSPASRPPPRAAPSTPCTTRSRRSAGWCRSSTCRLGEVIFGGVGAGLYGMLLFVIVAVFVAGLMVGRTPEYLGKKIEVRESEDGDARHPDPAADRPSSASPRGPW